MPASIAAHASSSMRGRSSEATFFCPLHPCVCSFAPARRFGALIAASRAAAVVGAPVLHRRLAVELRDQRVVDDAALTRRSPV